MVNGGEENIVPFWLIPMINIEWPNETFMPRLVIFCVLCFLLPSAHSQNKISFVYTSTENKSWTLRVRYLSAKTIEYDFSKSLRSELPSNAVSINAPKILSRVIQELTQTLKGWPIQSMSTFLTMVFVTWESESIPLIDQE